MRKILGLLLAIVAVCGSALAADEYKIDPNHSSVNFAVTHMTVSTVNGRFNNRLQEDTVLGVEILAEHFFKKLAANF